MNSYQHAAEVPRITRNLLNEIEHFTVEQNLTYSCEFEGFPIPVVSVYFNGQPIYTQAGASIANGTLTILSPQVFHSGIYQCIVNNEFGDDQQAWLLEIRQPSEHIIVSVLVSGDFRFIYRGGLSPQIKIKALSFQYKYTPQS